MKPKGPRGPPCWTPQQLRIERLSRRRKGWEPYFHDDMEGRRDLVSWNMVAQSTELNELEKSTSSDRLFLLQGRR